MSNQIEQGSEQSVYYANLHKNLNIYASEDKKLKRNPRVALP